MNCVYCQKWVHNPIVEPRFGFSTCEEHKDIPPMIVDALKDCVFTISVVNEYSAMSLETRVFKHYPKASQLGLPEFKKSLFNSVGPEFQEWYLNPAQSAIFRALKENKGADGIYCSWKVENLVWTVQIQKVN